MSTLTSTQIIAASGFLQNQGLTVNPDMVQTLGSYTSNPSNSFSTLSQTVISQANIAGFPMPDLGSSIAPWLTGVSPTGVTLPAGFNSGNVAGEITNQANLLLAQGTKGFQQFFGQGHGYSSMSFLFAGGIQEFQGKKFSDVGLNMNKYSDFVSGGVAKALGDLSSLANTIKNFGTLVDFKDLSNLANPGKLVQNLLKQGLGSFGGIQKALSANDISLKDLSDPNKYDQIFSVLKTIIGQDLQNIIKATGVTFPDPAKITSLADLLDINKILPKPVLDVLNSSISSLDDLATQLTSIAGSFSSVDDASNFLSSIETPSFQFLDSYNELLPTDIISSIQPYVMQGSGVFGNPTVTDLFGTAAGLVHTDAFKTNNDAQALLSNTPNGLALTSSLYNLQNVVNTPGQTAGNVAIARSQVESALSTLVNMAEGMAATAISNASTQYLSSLNQLLKEKNNISIAGINLTQTVTGSISSVLGLATQLHTYGIDSMKLNTNSLFEGLAANNVYGDAIKACLIEGRNISRIFKVGGKVANFANPITKLLS